MNWNKEFDVTMMAENSSVYQWGKLENVYNCDGVVYEKENEKIGFLVKRSIEANRKMARMAASLLREIADKLYPLPEDKPAY